MIRIFGRSVFCAKIEEQMELIAPKITSFEYLFITIFDAQEIYLRITSVMLIVN